MSVDINAVLTLWHPDIGEVDTTLTITRSICMGEEDSFTLKIAGVGKWGVKWSDFKSAFHSLSAPVIRESQL